MKKIIFLTLLAIPVIAQAQTSSFKIKGKVGNYNVPVKAYLIYVESNKQIIDSAMLVNGVFGFDGSIAEPTPAQLVFSYDGKSLQRNKNYDVLDLYVDKGTLSLASADSVCKAAISGSPVNKAYENLRDELAPVNKKASALRKEYFSAPVDKQKSLAYQDEMRKRDSAIIAEKNSILLSFIKTNPNTQVSLRALQQYAGKTPDANKIQPLFNSLSTSIRESVSGKKYAAYLISLQDKGTAIGSMAPEFSEPDTAGQIVKLSAFRGTYTLIDFWASWCGPCRAENPSVVAAYAKYHNKGFNILGVSLDQPNGKERWLNAIHHDGLTWTQVSDLKFWDNEVAVLYNIKSIPQNFLLDPNGKIIGRNLHGEELDKKLAELFK